MLSPSSSPPPSLGTTNKKIKKPLPPPHPSSSSGHGGAGGAGQPLVHNVVLTIEPGLYFPPDPSKWGRFAGVGMRLEDDVAVVDGDLSSGPEVLSSGAPLLPEDVARAIDGS